jgi:hypothetical protein
MKLSILILVAIVAVGCSSIQLSTEKPYTYKYKDNKFDTVINERSPYKQSDCVIGGPQSTQGHELCQALIIVDGNARDLGKKILGTDGKAFDAAQLLLAVLSAGALASDSHISLIEGLALGTGSVVAFQQWDGAVTRRFAYKNATSRLHCLKRETVSLLWEENSWYELRRKRRMIIELIGVLEAEVQKAKATPGADTTSAGSFVVRAENMIVAAKKSLDFIEKSVRDYSSMASLVMEKRMDILTQIKIDTDVSNADLQTLVQGIMNSVETKEKKEEDIQQEAESISETAKQNTGSEKSPTTKVQKYEEALDQAIRFEDVNKVAPPDRISSKVGQELQAISAQREESLSALSSAILVGTLLGKRYQIARVGVEACF